MLVNEASDGQAQLWRLVTKRGKAIVPLGGSGDGLPFYCVHSIGGEVTSLRRLAQVLGADRHVYGIQVPRDKLGGEFGASVHAIAECYADLLTAFQPEGPFLLGGWSAGSVIALETAQILRKRGREVSLLVVLDGLLRNSGGGMSAWNPLYQLKLVRNVPRWFSAKVAAGWRARDFAVHMRRRAAALAASLFGRLSGASPGAAADAFLDMSGWPRDQTEFAAALYAALEVYRPEPYDGRVLVYAAITEPLFNLSQVIATWSKIANVVESKTVEGTHVTMIGEPHVTGLAADLRKRMAALVPAAAREFAYHTPAKELKLAARPATAV